MYPLVNTRLLLLRTWSYGDSLLAKQQEKVFHAILIRSIPMRHYHPGGDTACALFRYYDFVPRRYLMPIAPIDKVWDSAISAHMNFGPRFVANITLFVEYSFAGKDPN